MIPTMASVMLQAGKRERTKAHNRGAILDAARDVFAELGYGAATVRDVVRRSGLAAGAFYKYFPPKEAVLRALGEGNAAGIRGRPRGARGRGAPREDFVRVGDREDFSHAGGDR